ncbi:MAG: phosphatidylethanolamine N-methyltransferase [Vezdaea aestivalis]|nr:MAG: phosphatidylethanolamine N-methyltransferase [Vezdaea aestivalis]
MDENGQAIATASEGLHERKSTRKPPSYEDNGSNEVVGAQSTIIEDAKPMAPKKTIGKTPDGSIFIVPQTHDMVSQLLSPQQPKNILDLFVLGVMGLHILAFVAVSTSFRPPLFASVFLFWRGCYNIGIGYLLHYQSQDRRLVCWAKKSKIFQQPDNSMSTSRKLYAFLKREFETKVPYDYSFDDAPVEYNTWLLFRRLVDLILMCDFVSYCLFAMSCATRPKEEGLLIACARWATGIALVGFNLWVKLDAHRVVKDYAWYWGDFFFLVDQELTFDGVFEMAPHPMYSVGYAGYYGISLMAASYHVLVISIIAHATQFAFLLLVENPHIEKTYNPPPPRKQTADLPGDQEFNTFNLVSPNQAIQDDDIPPPLSTALKPSPVHNLVGLQNIDLFRVTDTSVILLQIYLLLFTVMTPSTPAVQVLFLTHAIIWRLWYSMGIGYILFRQSTLKKWTRHFLKYGENSEESWRQWKGLYHLSMTMCHASFVAACWKMYTAPSDWGYGLILLRHVIGSMLIALQIWTSISIYESLGEFGWFYGDFFFDQLPKLSYGGIYRYLNNPERVIGVAGVWGAYLVTGTLPIFTLALLSHMLTVASIQFVERPHMQKLYGRNLRRDSGLVKSLKRSLPQPLRSLPGSVDKVLGETAEFMEDFIENARPKFAAGVNFLVKDTSALFSQYPARISLTRLAPDLAGYNVKDYSLKVDGTRSSPRSLTARQQTKEGPTARFPASPANAIQTVILEYGAPIRVEWTATLSHSKRDWIGLYMVSDNLSRDATRIASAGRWTATNPGIYDSANADRGILVCDQRISAASRDDGEEKDYVRGEMEFTGEKLWWIQGVFEFRYHHDGKHNVMAISQPFEVKINKFDEDEAELDDNGMIRGAVEAALLPLVRNCLDRHPDIAPNTIDEAYGSLVAREGKYSRRIVYAVHQMFGIEFAPEVVQADGNVKNLAWRICNAKKVLAPFSMSHSRGSDTPITKD